MPENIELRDHGQTQFIGFCNDPFEFIFIQSLVLPAEEGSFFKGKNTPCFQHHIIVFAICGKTDGAFDLIQVVFRKPADMQSAERDRRSITDTAEGQFVCLKFQYAAFFFRQLPQCFQRIQYAVTIRSCDADPVFIHRNIVCTADIGTGCRLFQADLRRTIPEFPDDRCRRSDFLRRGDYDFCSIIQTADSVRNEFKTDRLRIHPCKKDISFL